MAKASWLSIQVASLGFMDRLRECYFRHVAPLESYIAQDVRADVRLFHELSSILINV